MSYTLPTLPYGYDVLEPHIDAQTMEIHHTKHHQTYVDKLNAGLEKYPEYAPLSIEELVKSYPVLPTELKPLIATHGCGHFNHSLMRSFLAPVVGDSMPTGVFGDKVSSIYGSIDELQKQLITASMSHFGSGRCWLVESLQVDTDGNHPWSIITLPNQENPYMYGYYPLFGIDLREHAYYLKHQNRRTDYVAACLQCTNRSAVAQRYDTYSITK